MTQQPNDLDKALDGFLAQWKSDAFKENPEQKTLLIGNLRGFVAFLHILKLDELLDRLEYDIGAQNVATGTVERFEEWKRRIAKLDGYIKSKTEDTSGGRGSG